jgi:hypothetical protein
MALVNQNNLTLYHASYTTVAAVDLQLCRKLNDFGQGFYLTTSQTQAERFVRAAVLKSKQSQIYGFVNIYTFDSFNELNSYEFPATNQDWLNCVCTHRLSKLRDTSRHDWGAYDVIIGKIANDDTMTTINIYISGGYGQVGSDDAIATAIKLLKPERLQDQICLKAVSAVKRLNFLDAYEVCI